MKTAHDLMTEGGFRGAAEFLRQSDAIEHIHIPLESYQAEFLSVFPQTDQPDEGMLMSYVQNHIWALGYVLHNHDRLPKIGDVLEIHRRLMQNSRISSGNVGNFRQTTVFVEGDVPPNPASVPYAMDDLCFQLNRLEALAAHRQFEHIHPFVDGNGRTGRLLWLWLHLNRGGQIAPFLETCGFKGLTLDVQRAAYFQDLRQFRRAI